MKKLLISALLIMSVILTCVGCAVVEPTVLTVDGDEATVSEFNYYFSIAKLSAESQMAPEQLEMYWNTEKDGKTTFELLKDSAFNEMTALRVAAKKAEKEGISKNDSSVMQAKTGFKQQIMSLAQSEKEFYEMTNTTSDTIDKIAELYALRSALLNKLIVDGEINVSNEVLATTFNEKWMKAQHILISTQNMETGAPLSDEEKANKKAIADGALARVKKGEDFTTVMNELSEDPGKETSPDGYVFTDGEMVAEFEEAVKALKPNSISDIVESTYGYHIIKRIPLSAEADVESFQQMAGSIQSEIIMNYLEIKIPEWKQEMTIVEDKAPIDKIKL